MTRLVLVISEKLISLELAPFAVFRVLEPRYSFRILNEPNTIWYADLGLGMKLKRNILCGRNAPPACVRHVVRQKHTVLYSQYSWRTDHKRSQVLPCSRYGPVKAVRVEKNAEGYY